MATRPRHTDSTRKDTDADAEPYRDDCPICIKNVDTATAEGAQRRGRHYLALAEQDGVDALKHHLTLYMHRWYPEDPDKAIEVITGTLAWVWDEIRLYSDMADPETGAPLTWAEGRRQIYVAMRRTYAAIAARGKAAADAAPEVRGFQRVRAAPHASSRPEPAMLPHDIPANDGWPEEDDEAIVPWVDDPALDYTPTVDAAEAKQRAREHLAQIQAEEAQREEEERQLQEAGL